MTITTYLFEAFLKCPTKCYLQSLGEAGTENPYADWARTEAEAYRHASIKRFTEGASPDECVTELTDTTSLKTGKWRLAAAVLTQTRNLESRIHAIERISSEGRGSATFIPIRFILRNKLTKDDKLVLAFDAFVLSEALGCKVSMGRIIHGDSHSTFKVKTADLLGQVRELTEKINVLLSTDTAPDLTLNRHCGECEFQARCQQKALETDDLSLLAGMSVKERQELRSKGIFTVTQLSYTFRPRRRPKYMRDKREKYHHSLKALAIRQKKIHIVGSPELKIEGTPVYLDVEGLPDRDFYYLIGVRIGNGESAVQYSLWAAAFEDEGKIWREFLAILKTVNKPVLIHYGSYETDFLKRMTERHDWARAESADAKVIGSTVNLLSFIFGQIYFPTYSNSLKDIGKFMGFSWPDPELTGRSSVMWRHRWEESMRVANQQTLLAYNCADCEALEILHTALAQLPSEEKSGECPQNREVTFVTPNMPHRYPHHEWTQFASPMPVLEEINRAAQWDYQRDRIYIRKKAPSQTKARRGPDIRTLLGHAQKVIAFPERPYCPKCGRESSDRIGKYSRTLHDFLFGRSSVKRRVVRHEFQRFRCATCGDFFGVDNRFYTTAKFGRNIMALYFYLSIDLGIAQQRVAKAFDRLFDITITTGDRTFLKEKAYEYYKGTTEALLKRIVEGHLVHADETQAGLRTRMGYVWIFSNRREVVYLYSESRESDLLVNTLRGFKGVLVTDFYAAYDSIDCPQQKCLIHLIRELNEELLSHPYDEELKQVIRNFAEILRSIIATIDRYGLKRHWLKKHRQAVDQFYRRLGRTEYGSDAALNCKQRFERNRDKLFTFLDYDGVPWNNNAAEHAAKAYSRLREAFRGAVTPKALRETLVLLSMCETCRNMGIDFLDFLCSGEKDIQAFAESRRGCRHGLSSNEPKARGNRRSHLGRPRRGWKGRR